MFTKELLLDEIKFGEILFSDDSMDMFPRNGEEIILVDVYQERYIAHIHPSENSIVGVWAMHKNNEAQEGMTITIRLIDPLHNTYRVYYDD
ncbi:MAG: hypothetical protein IJ634_08460 [Bacteroidales bacterium]|nr:hypothetical protein [Bacteroidales bacterium]